MFILMHVYCRQKCLNKDGNFILEFTSDGITGARRNKWKRGDTARPCANKTIKVDKE